MADETMEPGDGGQEDAREDAWQGYHITTPRQLTKEILEEIDALWHAADCVGSATSSLWERGDSLSRAVEDMNADWASYMNDPTAYAEMEKRRRAEGYYDPDPMQVWSRGMCYAVYDGQHYDMAFVRRMLDDFNTIAKERGVSNQAEAVCVRVLLERVLTLGEAPANG